MRENILVEAEVHIRAALFHLRQVTDTPWDVSPLELRHAIFLAEHCLQRYLDVFLDDPSGPQGNDAGHSEAVDGHDEPSGHQDPSTGEKTRQ